VTRNRVDLEPRRGEVVLGRAAAAGVAGGALLGALVLLPDLLAYRREADPEVAAYMIDPSGVLVGAAFGALVGLVAAVAAAAAWLLTVEGPPPRPQLSRAVAGLVAGGVVVVAGAIFIGVPHWLAAVVIVGFAIVAAVLAAALAPTIGYKARR
jgi:hypothetical protein